MTQVPVFINCRDRLTPLIELIDFLERAGCERIHLLDNASTYPPLLEYYEQTPHDVLRLKENHDHRWFWESGLLEELGVTGRYVFSDPDTVPIEECPLDAIGYFGEVLDRYPAYSKVGFGLRIDDLPDHFALKREVIAWESRFWHRLVAPRLYEARIDTTFALYGVPEHAPVPAIRTGYPYLVRHTTWYLDSDNLPEEHRYYVEHEEGVTRWGRKELGEGQRQKVERLAADTGTAAAVEPMRAPPGRSAELFDFVSSLVRTNADVTVLDSTAELAEWWRAAEPGAFVVVPGVAEQADAAGVADAIRELGIPGAFLEQLGGAFVGLKPAAGA